MKENKRWLSARSTWIGAWLVVALSRVLTHAKGLAMAENLNGPTVEQVASAFARAVSAAEKFRGATSPNPPVGCVVLDELGQELACAAHEKAGEPHAEALALAQCRTAGTIPRIHTIIVTLEPCNHTGRTAPCCDAILATPAKAVWIGAADPNENVKGGGALRLAEAGLKVCKAPERVSAACLALIAPFKTRVVHSRPYVTVKQALNADGSMIPPRGQKTFTSQKSLLLAHQLRKRADAIITGSGTVLADNPHFTVRHVPDHPGKRRGLYILDRRGRVPEQYYSACRKRGFNPHCATSLVQALRQAQEEGAIEVLVEAGPTLTKHVLTSGPWDEHFAIHASLDPGVDDHLEHCISNNHRKEIHVLRHC